MKHLLLMIGAALLITGCGDGSDGSHATITLHADDCTDIQSGDTLKKLQENTVIEITHDLDGSRSVCVSSGEALLTFAAGN